MLDKAREQHVKKIKELEEEAKNAGTVRKRDLAKAIKRTKDELTLYDSYHAHAKRQKESAKMCRRWTGSG